MQPQAYWKTRANCLGADPELFFGDSDGLPQARAIVEEARKWCRLCPVARDCLIFALQNNERYGIWGGLTVEERKRTREIANDLLDALRYFDRGNLLTLVVRL